MRTSARTAIYDGFSTAGYASSSYGGRWNIYSGGSRLGYVKRSYGGRWNVYEGSFTRVGYVKRSWNVYEGSFTRIGYVKAVVRRQIQHLRRELRQGRVRPRFKPRPHRGRRTAPWSRLIDGNGRWL